MFKTWGSFIGTSASGSPAVMGDTMLKQMKVVLSLEPRSKAGVFDGGTEWSLVYLPNGLHVHRLAAASIAGSYDPFGELPGPGWQSSERIQRREAPCWHGPGT